MAGGAPAARYAAFRKIPVNVVALAHNLDDQAETVLMNLLRGAGLRGASGMARESRFEGKKLLRPLLDTSRNEIEAYARRHGLEWIEDESNADESLTRNFIRRRVGPLLEERYPRWRENLARSARHFSRKEAQAQYLRRKYLSAKGLRAPTEAKLVEMLKQLTGAGSRTLIEHDGARLRVYRGKILHDRAAHSFSSIPWKGEARLPIPELGGELRFRTARGKGIAASARPLRVRLRSGGERLQPDARRPRRLFSGEDLVWAPGLGIDARYQAGKNAFGVLPEWRRIAP